MAPSVRVRLGKKAKPGPCGNCEGEIPQGELHTAVMKSFGQSRKGVTKYKGDHVHMICLPAFLIQDYTKYMGRERKPKGRQAGSSPFKIPKEQRKERKHLIWTRARLLRLMLAAETPERIVHLKGRIIEIQTKLREYGGPVRTSMMRRSDEARADLEAKLNV